MMPPLIALVKAAGDKILSTYNDQSTIEVHSKADNSPVTEADLAANECLLAGLSVIDAGAMIVSEEADIPDYSIRQQWSRYWLIDPLDGTQEFIAGSGEFTVNLALIEKGVPILGLVYQPVTNTLYVGMAGQGAFCYRDGTKTAIFARSMGSQIKRGLPLVAVTSRRHGLEKLDGFLKNSPVAVQPRAVGSSLKLCLIAAGEADIYPRFGPTSEWDTAAAQAIVEAAGGHVLDMGWRPLRYNQKASLLNPEFIVIGSDPDLAKETFG